MWESFGSEKSGSADFSLKVSQVDSKTQHIFASHISLLTVFQIHGLLFTVFHAHMLA